MANLSGMREAENRALDYIVEHWKIAFALLMLAAAAGMGLFAYEYAGYLEKIGIFLGLFMLGLALKYPGRYTTAGGTDVDTVLIILVSAGMGVKYGLLFALAFIPLGRRISLESPQEALFSLAMHSALSMLTGFFSATPENIVIFVMAFVLLSVLIAGPVLYYAGHPPQPLAIGIIVKVVWAYVFMGAFGVQIFELLT